MSAIGPFVVPILAAGAFAATLGWFGYQYVTQPEKAAPAVAVQQQPAAPQASPADGRRPDMPVPPQDAGRPQQSASAKPADVAPSPKPTPEAAAPAFDVVRVEPTGETVVAGRATPGATVELVRNGVRQARVVADPSGLFALVPEALPPGTHEMSLQVANGDGVKARSQQSVTVVVAANRRDAPLVTITAPGQPAVVLSRPDAPSGVTEAKVPEPTREADSRPGSPSAAPAPDAPKPVAEPAKARRSVQIVSVETEGAGRLLVSGSASPSAVVRLYLNETFIAPASAGADGRLSFAIARGMQPGAYKVRLDDVDPVSGQVRSRAEVPFDMPYQVAAAPRPEGATPASRGEPAGRLAAADGAPAARVPASDRSSELSPSVVVPEVNTAMVSRGDSLWAISKRTYGAGLRYSVIYGANAKQIRDPNLIYPGQLFVLPVKDGEAATR